MTIVDQQQDGSNNINYMAHQYHTNVKQSSTTLQFVSKCRFDFEIFHTYRLLTTDMITKIQIEYSVYIFRQILSGPFTRFKIKKLATPKKCKRTRPERLPKFFSMERCIVR